MCEQLERELNAANEMFRKLNIHALDLTDRIRRLEQENDALRADLLLWRETVEAKP
jgi:predicted  nucleic acid-binding Zn-ribbon protein